MPKLTYATVADEEDSDVTARKYLTLLHHAFRQKHLVQPVFLIPEDLSIQERKHRHFNSIPPTSQAEPYAFEPNLYFHSRATFFQRRIPATELPSSRSSLHLSFSPGEVVKRRFLNIRRLSSGREKRGEKKLVRGERSRGRSARRSSEFGWGHSGGTLLGGWAFQGYVQHDRCDSAHVWSI